MQTEHVFVGNIQEDLGRVNETLEDYLYTLRIAGDDAKRFNLLAEEAIRFMDTIAGEDIPIEVWFDGDARVSNICLRLSQKMDVDSQEELVSVSSTGTNSAEKTFIDQLRTFFVKPETPTWSLKEYQAELMAKRERDKYDQDAWDNLERSVLANLASDITVSVKDSDSLMVIKKDFTESLKSIGSKKPIVVTKPIAYDNDKSSEDRALESVDFAVDQLSLSKENKLRVKLLFEETIGMMKALAVDFDAIVYAEKYVNAVAIKLVASTDMNFDKKADFIDVSSNKKNALAKGFMGKISDLFETSALSYDSVMSLEQEYNSGSIAFGSMGMYGNPGLGYDPDLMGGVMWSLADYRSQLDENDGEAVKEAWDELEKSIVASLADDVIVGIKKNHVEMTIIYKLK
jgi:hypothetical protein